MNHFFIIPSNILLLIVIAIYLNQIRKGQSDPNATTWLIWSVVGLINTLSYIAVVQNDYWQAAITITATGGLTTIFLYSLLKGKFKKLGTVDTVCLILAAIVGALWQISGNADITNISLQAIYVISFIPTVHGILKETHKEKSLAWDLAVIAYSFSVIGVLTTEDFRWQALFYPVVNGVLGNGAVDLAIHYKKWQRKKAT
jgi:hypothetical protein